MPTNITQVNGLTKASNPMMMRRMPLINSTHHFLASSNASPPAASARSPSTASSGRIALRSLIPTPIHGSAPQLADLSVQPPAQTLAPNVANATCQQSITEVAGTIGPAEHRARVVLREQVAHPHQPKPLFEPARQRGSHRGTPSVSKLISGRV